MMASSSSSVCTLPCPMVSLEWMSLSATLTSKAPVPHACVRKAAPVLGHVAGRCVRALLTVSAPSTSSLPSNSSSSTPFKAVKYRVYPHPPQYVTSTFNAIEQGLISTAAPAESRRTTRPQLKKTQRGETDLSSSSLA